MRKAPPGQGRPLSARARLSAEEARLRAAAQWLIDSHRRRERFAPLPAELAPKTIGEAYAVQDVLVALRSDERGPIVGRKIALTTPQMQRMVGVDRPQAGALLESTVRRAPARLRAADFVHLLVEFEIAVELADDLPVADAPFTRERVARAVGAIMPAFEIADDWDVDYKTLPQHALQLIADNAWNEGAVLGTPRRDWRHLDLAALRAVGRINGEKVGEGVGGDAMGHPLDVVAWIANHLAESRIGLIAGNVVITGSLVPSKFPQPGDRVSFSVEQLGEIELQVE